MNFFTDLLQLLSVMSVSNGAATYPKDDYISSVNFSLSEPAEDLKFVLFTNTKNPCASKNCRLENFPTKVLIHGWQSSIEKSVWYEPTRDEYLLNGPHNVIFVGYEKVAAKLYTVAAASSKNVGEAIAQYLMTLNGINMDNVHLLGHSLGSHVAGFVGRHIEEVTGKKIARITALDPAGPKFENCPEKLNKEDAKFVDIVHTDDGHYGLRDPIGHVDFFPNGGSYQPGCPSFEIDDNCSHARSTKYFMESINFPLKTAQKSKSWNDFKDGKFIDKGIVFGELCSQKARGSFYFKTSDKSPFLK